MGIDLIIDSPLWPCEAKPDLLLSPSDAASYKVLGSQHLTS